MIQWGEPPKAEQDDPIGGGRVQELLQAGLTVEQEFHNHGDQPTAGKTIVESRQDLYGDAVPNIERVARGWSILAETNITPQMVPLMMVWLKLVRQSQAHLVDNLDDIEGYVEIMRRVIQELGE